RQGQDVVRCTEAGTGPPQRITTLLTVEALQRRPADVAAAGEIVYLAGLPDIAVGDTVADAEYPEPLPRLEVSQPTLRMQFSVNQSPFAGREATTSSTSRQLRARLARELQTNIALKVADGATADIFEVSGRGELHMAILTLTRGTGVMSTRLVGWERWRTLPSRTRNGVLTASQTGMAVAYGLQGVQERGQPFIGPGTQVYEGMIIGLNRRGGDIDVNAT